MVSDDAIESAWREVLAAFDDEAAHKKFLTLCASLDRLAEAGQRYRAIKDDPDDARAPMAQMQVSRLLGLAMKNLESTKSDPGQKRSQKTTLFLIAFGVSGALILSALWSMLRAT